jgi:hypothetical protein
MEVRTFTSFWALEKKLYTINDITLPFPVSLRVLGVFVASGIPWWGLMLLLNIPWGSPWYLIWLIPPVGLAWGGSKEIFEKKTLFQYVRSHIQYLFENKGYKGLEPDLNKYNETIQIAQNVITLQEKKPKKNQLFSR